MNIINRLIRKSISEALALLPFSLLIKIHRKKLLLPLYHAVSDNRIPHVINLFPYCDVKQFEMDLNFLQKYFSPISMNDLMNSIKGNMDLPDNSFLLSFDDGLREVFEVIAPILKRRGVPAVLFLNSAFIDNRDMSFRYKASLLIDRLDTIMQPEIINKLSTIVQTQVPTLKNIKAAILGVKYQNRHLLDEAAKVMEIDFTGYLHENQPYMNSNEIRDLIHYGFMIGAHSIDHPLFRDISLDEQLTQVLTSLSKLKEQFDIPYNAFAFPFSDNGVAKEFFDQTHKNGIIDVSFGTSDFSKGHCTNNLQRQPMEGRAYNADLIYKNLYRHEILKDIKKGLYFMK